MITFFVSRAYHFLVQIENEQKITQSIKCRIDAIKKQTNCVPKVQKCQMRQSILFHFFIPCQKQTLPLIRIEGLVHKLKEMKRNRLFKVNLVGD